jgi:general secretion pathway protein D
MCGLPYRAIQGEFVNFVNKLKHRSARSASASASALALSLALATPLSLVATPAFAQDSITLNFINADIPSVIKAIGGHTGKNFIIDPRVTGNVNIISQVPVSKDVAYQILLTTLRVSGYAAIEERGAVKIVPEADAKTSGSVVQQAGAVAGDRIVTQVFALQNESAAQIATILRPLVSANNFIGAYPGNNTLVITDYASNVDRIRKIIGAIDVPSSADLQTITLKHASAVDIANLITRLMPEATPNPSNPGAPAKLAVGVEPRTNALIVRADTPALVTRVRALAAQIDTPTAASGNIHVVYLKNAEAAKVAETLRGLLSGGSGVSTTNTLQPAPGAGLQPQPTGGNPGAVSSTIQAYVATNSLIITAPDHVYNSLRAVIEKLDQRRAQVFVEALIVEVSSSVAAEFGIQWQDLTGVTRNGVQVIGGTNFGSRPGGTNIIDAAQNIGTVGTGLNIGVVRGSVTIPGLGTVLNLGALARALESDQRANVLSTPNILTLDNEEAKFVSGQNVPFVTGSFTQSSTAGAANPFQTIERRDIGLTLRVTPQIAEGGAVKLKVFQEISSIVPTSSTVKSSDLITNKRSVENTVLVDDGAIAVIGGLVSDDTKNGESRVPLLGSIPVLGNLFKSQTRSREKTNLMIFLRPVVLRDGKSATQLMEDRYNYIRGEQVKHLEQGESLLPPSGTAVLPATPSITVIPSSAPPVPSATTPPPATKTALPPAPTPAPK